jgi:hypothetical protein
MMAAFTSDVRNLLGTKSPAQKTQSCSGQKQHRSSATP